MSDSKPGQGRLIAIIGAGPSGLVTAKYALEQGFKVQIYEAEAEVGGTFRYRAYENSELVSSRQLTAFSDFRITDDYCDRDRVSSRDHVMLSDYTRYLRDYAQKYGVLEHIQFNARVVSVAKLEGKERPRFSISWVKTAIGTEDEGSKAIPGHGDVEGAANQMQTIEADYVAVCSGLHVYPNFPTIEGYENLEKNGTRVLHSSAYKNSDCLKGRKVLICGLGETANDVGYDSVQVAEQTVMCHRHGFLSFPKRFQDFEIFGQRFDAELPIDTLISNLHEAAYVHQYLKDTRFRWFFSDRFVRLLLLVLTGTSIGANQHVAPAKKIGRSYNFLMKSTRAMPYINASFKKRHWWERFARVIEPDTQGKSISVYPWISHVDSKGYVHFIDNGTPEAELYKKQGPYKPDIVVLATGYRQDYSFLAPGLPTPPDADLRDITKEGCPEVGFIGFTRPNVGAIPPIAEMQAQWWLQLLLGGIKEEDVRDPHPHWHLLGREEKRIKYGVDHSSYVYQMAKDVGGAPSVYPPEEIFKKEPKLLQIYAMAASFNTCFRMVGPYRWDGASEVMRGELWETVTRRGWLGNTVMGLIPMAWYGTVNLAVYTTDKLLNFVGLSLHA